MAIGSHLLVEFGYTIEEIIDDGYTDVVRLKTTSGLDGELNIAKEIAATVGETAGYLAKERPSCIIILGDRTEMLGVATAALVSGIPVAHLHGGEATEGLVDDYVRHAITKLSFLHFVSTEAYRKRVIQMGENPARVFSVGAIGLDNLRNYKRPSRTEVLRKLELDLDRPLIICTYHPLTLNLEQSARELDAILENLSRLSKQFSIVFTGVNGDLGNSSVRDKIAAFRRSVDTAMLFESLGTRKYFDLISISEFVIGNSSSAIIEVPSFGVPTVDVGDRQGGRVRSESVISVSGDYLEIEKGIELALAMKKSMDAGVQFVNPYYKKKSAAKSICEILKVFRDGKENNRSKPFFDLETI